MSRELLKRVIAECIDEGIRSNITTKLYGAITEYLEMPEPEYAIPVYTTPPDQSARIAELEDQLTKYRKLLATRVEASRLSEANEQLADQSALIVELKAALQLAKDMMIANDLSLPRTFEVIDEALAKAKGEVCAENY